MRARSGGMVMLGLVLGLGLPARADVGSRADRPDALREQCQLERAAGDFARAIASCERAVAAAPTEDNLLALSDSLAARGRPEDLRQAATLADRAMELDPRSAAAVTQRLEVAALERDLPTARALLSRAGPRLDSAEAEHTQLLVAYLALEAGDSGLALALSAEATARAPDDYEAHVVLARAALAEGELEHLSRAAERLLALAPDAPYGHYAAAALAAADGRVADARIGVIRARALGMDAESCDALLATLPPALPLVSGMLAPMLGALLLGVIVFVAFLLAAWRLGLRLRDAARVGVPSPSLVRAHRRVVALTFAYAYLSLPLLGLLTIALVGASLQTLLAVGSLSLGLALPLLFVGAFVLVGVLEAAFVKPRRSEPTLLDLREHPQLAAILAETAARCDAKPVRRVSLTVGAGLDVVDEGTFAAILRGRGVRTLRLGVALLDGLDVAGLGALIARELRARDGAGSDLTHSLDAALCSLEEALRHSGAGTLLNPAVLMLRVARRVLARVSIGAIAYDERRAEACAAALYGGRTLAAALRDAVAARARFAAHVRATLDEVVAQRSECDNFYAYRAATPPDHAVLDATIERAWSEQPSDGDDAPPAAHAARISTIPRAGPSLVGAAEREPAWTLLHGREALEARMTRLIRHDLARLGVAMGGPAEADAFFRARRWGLRRGARRRAGFESTSRRSGASPG